jgi:hypothetical protein
VCLYTIMMYHLAVFIQSILFWVSDSSDTTALEIFCVLVVSLSLNYVFLEDDMSCNMRIRSRPARPRTQHDCHRDMKVKPEAATAVVELLTMGGRTPETC